MQVVNGQQGLAVVLEAGAECERPQDLGLVAGATWRGDLIAIQHAGVHEGGESIDLVVDFVLLLYQAEEGDAVLLTGDAWVIGRGLRWKRSHLHGSPS